MFHSLYTGWNSNFFDMVKCPAISVVKTADGYVSRQKEM